MLLDAAGKQTTAQGKGLKYNERYKVEGTDEEKNGRTHLSESESGADHRRRERTERLPGNNRRTSTFSLCPCSPGGMLKRIRSLVLGNAVCEFRRAAAERMNRGDAPVIIIKKEITDEESH